jgi:hypothetical protein
LAAANYQSQKASSFELAAIRGELAAYRREFASWREEFVSF